jgi:shikimate kinase
MTATRMMRNLALIGFMGSGKSSVGKMVAELLGFEFLDTDHEIEERAGKRISVIFEQDGEPVFREWERRMCQMLEEKTGLVIATGGGLPLPPANLESLKRHSLVVCLWATPNTILERVSGHSHRPLLQAPDPHEKIRALLAQRDPFYRQADVLVNTEMRSPREVALQVSHQFQTMRTGPG